MRTSFRLLIVVFTGLLLSGSSLAQYPAMNFPMHVGDRWQFSEVPGMVSETLVVGDTILSNGLKYSILSGMYVSGLYRLDGPRLYQRRGGTDALICDFSGKPGDSLGFYRYSTDTSIVSVRDQGLWLCFDQLRFQMRFFHRSMHSPGIMRAQYQVADSVGFVAIDEETIHFRLVGAVINGRQFGLITSVAQNPHEIPEVVHLLHNYPNPFNGTTVISFHIGMPSEVSVSIYDVMGRRIADLLSVHSSRGSFTLKWDAAQNPSGVYFCRLSAGGTVKTTAMILTR